MNESKQQQEAAPPISEQPQKSEAKKVPLLGVVLIAVGIVWLLDNWWHWLDEVWLPVLVIALGVYWIYRKR